MKKLSFFFWAVLGICGVCSQAQAGTVTTQSSTRITSIVTYQDSTTPSNGGFTYIIVEDNGTRSPLPSCQTAPSNYWIVNKLTDANSRSAQISQLMMAFSQGRPIYIQGRSNCQSGMEVIEYVQF